MYYYRLICAALHAFHCGRRYRLPLPPSLAGGFGPRDDQRRDGSNMRSTRITASNTALDCTHYNRFHCLPR